ncbi:polysaccharide pyruvyl transferase family protein, partial [candidate division WOR-3 bacterium]|nr:polysaccharide pyruvyl transferase family protein [candidate division WOR-3 bacterium]
MRAKRILISAYIGSANVGDEAIISSIISQIRSKIEPVKITVFSLNPSHTSSSFGVRVFSSWSILRVVYEIFKTDVYICGGGGIVQDETSIFSLPLVLWKPYLASLLNKKVMFYAIGIGP